MRQEQRPRLHRADDVARFRVGRFLRHLQHHPLEGAIAEGDVHSLPRSHRQAGGQRVGERTVMRRSGVNRYFREWHRRPIPGQYITAR